MQAVQSTRFVGQWLWKSSELAELAGEGRELRKGGVEVHPAYSLWAAKFNAVFEW
jgi:hypothetical protein